jgi:hypothetical protein
LSKVFIVNALDWLSQESETTEGPSSAMAETLQARCPGCRRLLRIPAEWRDRGLRCKHCGSVVRLPTPGPTIANPAQPPPVRVLLNKIQPAPEKTKRYRSLAAGVALFTVVAVLATASWLWFAGGKQPPSRAPSEPVAKAPVPHPPVADVKPKAPVPPIPRLLVISVNDYWYAEAVGDKPERASNGQPVGSSSTEQGADALVERLGELWHIPGDQRMLLSDRAPPKISRQPRKTTIETAVREFLDGSRVQNPIVLVFIGHAVERDGEPCFVPVDGELNRKETLIPLPWLFDQLVHSRAGQKLLIVDTSRRKPSRDADLPGSEALSAKTEAMLAHPPAGVEVWSACGAGQFSYEQDRPAPLGFTTGIFLNELLGAYAGIAASADPLTFANSHAREGVASDTARKVRELYGKKQTPCFFGQAPRPAPASTSNDSMPAPLIIPQEAPQGPAAAKLLTDIVQEINALPPIKTATHTAWQLRPNMLDSAGIARLASYVNPTAKLPEHAAVQQMIRLLAQPKFTRPLEMHFVPKPDEARFKANVLKRQRDAALQLAELDDMITSLRSPGQEVLEGPAQSRNADYLLLLARLLARRAYLYEYNFMLGQIRKDALPPLVAGVHTGWKLVPQEAPASGKEAERMSREARQILARVAEQCPGTPWEIAAKRDQLTYLGLAWVPVR